MKPNAPPRFNWLTEVEPSGDFEFEVGRELRVPPGASDEDGDRLTFTVEPLPAGATFDAAKGVLTWTPTRAQLGKHRLTFRVSDGRNVDRRDVLLVVRENRAPLGRAEIVIVLAEDRPPQPTANDVSVPWQVIASDPDGDELTVVVKKRPPTAHFLPSPGLLSMSLTNNGRDAFVCEDESKSSDCRSSHFRIYAEFEVLASIRAHASSLFTYSVGYTSNFEWNPARCYLIPHYGGAVGGLFRSGVGHRAAVHPYLGLHLWADSHVWVNLTLGYRVVPAGLRDLSGPTAGLVAMLNPW